MPRIRWRFTAIAPATVPPPNWAADTAAPACTDRRAPPQCSAQTEPQQTRRLRLPQVRIHHWYIRRQTLAPLPQSWTCDAGGRLSCGEPIGEGADGQFGQRPPVTSVANERLHVDLVLLRVGEDIDAGDGCRNLQSECGERIDGDQGAAGGVGERLGGHDADAQSCITAGTTADDDRFTSRCRQPCSVSSAAVAGARSRACRRVSSNRRTPRNSAPCASATWPVRPDVSRISKRGTAIAFTRITLL